MGHLHLCFTLQADLGHCLHCLLRATLRFSQLAAQGCCGGRGLLLLCGCCSGGSNLLFAQLGKLGAEQGGALLLGCKLLLQSGTAQRGN